MRIKERLADGGAVLRSLTRRSRDQTGSIFDAEARRCGEKRGEAEGGKTRDSRVRRRAEGAESTEEEESELRSDWQAEARPTKEVRAAVGWRTQRVPRPVLL